MALQAPSIEGFEIVEIDMQGQYKQQVLNLLKSIHYYDLYEDILPDEEYVSSMKRVSDEELLQRALKPLLGDDEVRFFGYFKRESLVAFMALSVVQLAPTCVPALWIPKFWAATPSNDLKDLFEGIVPALLDYAKRRKCRVLRISIPRHSMELREVFESAGGRLALAEVDCVIAE